MQVLDMTGQACPIPVVQAKKLLAQPQVPAAEVLVDNAIAVQNLEKMAKGLGYGFSYTQKGEQLFAVQFTKNGMPRQAADAVSRPAAPTAETQTTEGPTVLITAEGMGRGADELGGLLMKGYIFSLTELDPLPKAVIFLNGGARLTSEGAATLKDLHVLAEKGTEILTCGTCVNYYGLGDKLAVGAITDMMGISQRIAAAVRLITL